MKFISIIGTRPNIIKLAPMHKAIVNAGHTHIIIHTGQHYSDTMSRSLMVAFGLPEPDYELGLHGGWLTGMLSSMLQPIGDILNKELPDMVFVYGDVVSSLAGALSSVQNQHPVSHIEAGTRNHDMRITEHFNRVLIDRVSQLNFCSTIDDHSNLVDEGMVNKSFLVGDVMKDVFLSMPTKKQCNTDYILLTMHRPENVDEKTKLMKIFDNLGKVDSKIVFPAHPRTWARIKRFGIDIPDNIDVIEPTNYKQMCDLIFNSRLVITDSGGLQKEAYWAYKPCVVLFDGVTWPGIFHSGNQAIVRESDYSNLPVLCSEFLGSINHPNLFGDGHASEKIVKIIMDKLNSDIDLFKEL